MWVIKMEKYKSFIIGDMNEELAVRLSKKGCIGLGIDADTAQHLVQDSKNYKLEDLSGKWFLDIPKAIIGKGIPREFDAEKVSKLVPEVIGSQVLERVCLTAVYNVSEGLIEKDIFYVGLLK